MPGGKNSRGPAALQSAHQPQPGLQSAMISLDRVVRIPLDGVQGRGDQLVEDPGVGRCAVGGDLGRDGACAAPGRRTAGLRPGPAAPPSTPTTTTACPFTWTMTPTNCSPKSNRQRTNAMRH